MTTLSANDILLKLKNYHSCNDELAMTVRKTVLEPFQLDLSRPETIKPSPSPQAFKQMATKLAPFALRIVNQNLETLTRLKKEKPDKAIYTVVVNCLVDSSFYALSALRHMNPLTTLKPLSIEKTTSNIITKIVELGEHGRALHELTKFRVLLASIMKITLENNKSSQNDGKAAKVGPSPTGLSSALRDSSNTTAQSLSSDTVPANVINSQWEKDMLNKYDSLFQFPLDNTINDRTMILLILAYQMNAVLCFCEAKDGSIAKFIPYLFEKSGNFLDWSRQLFLVDDMIAERQLDALRKTLMRVIKRYPVNEENSLYIYSLQCLALKTYLVHKPKHLKLVLEQLVRYSYVYEQTATSTLLSYSYIQKQCELFLQRYEPCVDDIPELNAYFALCNFYAYVSRKSKSFKGGLYAYKQMIQTLGEVIFDKDKQNYYCAAYATMSKLSVASLQMDKIVDDDTFVDVIKTLEEAETYLKVSLSTSNAVQSQDQYAAQALVDLCKSIDSFRQNARKVYEFALEKALQKLKTAAEDPFRTPPRAGELATPNNFGKWNTIIPQLKKVLQLCIECTSDGIRMIKSKFDTLRQKFQMDKIITAFVESTVLLARMQFKVEETQTHYQAFELLRKAEDQCINMKFSSGYKLISGTYYSMGVSMIKADMYFNAILPIRKSCVLLEKCVKSDINDQNKLELCKRYEILGTCCVKDRNYKDAIVAYKLGLRQVPTSEIRAFIKQGETTAVSAIMGNDCIMRKLMDRFLRISVIDPEQDSITFASEHLNLSDFNPVQQCIVYECELKIWNVIALKMKLTRFQLFIIEKLLEVYKPDEYPIRRARILLEQARIERTPNNISVESLRKSLKCASEAYELLKKTEYANDSNLLYYRRSYLALAISWIALCSHELKQPTSVSFAHAIHHWATLLQKINPIYEHSPTSEAEKQQIYKEIDDVNALYAHLQMLSDLFSINGQYTFQINILRLLLKLNNGFRNEKDDFVSDSIMITCDIAKIYINLGYTGRALGEIEEAREAISRYRCSAYAELTYLLTYSQYLASIRKYNESKDAYSKARLTWTYRASNETRKTQQTCKQLVTKSLILSEAHFTKCMLPSNTPDNAINGCTAALQILDRCLKTLNSSGSSEPKPLFDPFSNDTQRREREEKLSIKDSQWRIAQKMGKYMETISNLYMTKGSWNEAKYYVVQGINLSQRVQSKSMLCQAFLCSSDFNLRYGNLEESQKDIERAIQCRFSNRNSLDQIQIYTATASLSIANKMYEEAIQMYDEANKSLDALSNPKHVASLEKFGDKNLADSTDDMDVDMAHAYSPLQRMKGNNIIQKAAIYYHKNAPMDGISILEDLKDSGLEYDEFLYNATMGHLKLECILAELSKYDGLKQEDIKSLPIMSYVSKQTRTSTSERTTNHLHTLWNELADCLAQITDAFQTGVTRERVMAIHRTCNDAGLAAFLKTQVEAKIQQLVNRNALLSAYYLEMAKGIHIRRLTRSSLSEKLQKFNGYLPSLDDWPADDHESSGNRPRLNTATLMPKWLQSHITTLLEQYDRDHLLDDVQFQQQYVDIIPSNWTVCSLTLDPTHNDLYAVQMRAGESPFILKLPLNRVVKRCKGEQNECVEYQEVDTEMKSIVQESDETIQYSSQCKTPEAVREWWTKRHSLDTRLKNLLYRVEGWFGGFKGILCGQRMESNNQIKKFQEGLNKLIHKVVMKSANKKAKIEFSLQLCRIILQLGESPSNRELEDVACFTLSCYDDCLIDIDSNRTNVDEVTKGLHSLITAYHENSKRNGIDTSSNKRNDHVILILDKYMQILPMESLPILRKQATSRLPCLSFLRDRILYAKSKKMGDVSIASDESNAGNNLSVSGQSVYYVLNPSGDLLDTQKQFEKLFKSNQNWNGIAGAAPMELQCKDALLSKDIYMYFGHSAGQSFLRGTTVRSLPKCAVSILMGCSSGKMESNGEYDPHGYILNYLIAGSPAVLGNLWDVTDRSIDNITRHMLQAWGAIGKNQGRNQEKSLVQALTESRDQCNLQYLIGAAPVVYGVPIYLE